MHTRRRFGVTALALAPAIVALGAGPGGLSKRAAARRRRPGPPVRRPGYKDTASLLAHGDARAP